METKAMIFACEAHAKVNHLYDNKPYSIHLTMVVDCAKKHIDIIPEQCQNDVIAACWLHDTIEDCRLTYNDIKNEFGETVADIVYAVTNEKGRNRKERASENYYRGIRNTPWATFVKMCDRLANIKYSAETNSRMIEVYRKEHSEFMELLILKQASSQRIQFFKMIAEMEAFTKQIVPR